MYFRCHSLLCPEMKSLQTAFLTIETCCCSMIVHLYLYFRYGLLEYHMHKVLIKSYNKFQSISQISMRFLLLTNDKYLRSNHPNLRLVKGIDLGWVPPTSSGHQKQMYLCPQSRSGLCHVQLTKKFVRFLPIHCSIHFDICCVKKSLTALYAPSLPRLNARVN